MNSIVLTLYDLHHVQIRLIRSTSSRFNRIFTVPVVGSTIEFTFSMPRSFQSSFSELCSLTRHSFLPRLCRSLPQIFNHCHLGSPEGATGARTVSPQGLQAGACPFGTGSPFISKIAREWRFSTFWLRASQNHLKLDKSICPISGDFIPYKIPCAGVRLGVLYSAGVRAKTL